MKRAGPGRRGQVFERFRLVDAAVAVTLGLLLIHAAGYFFLTDDAFISFRYARNLAQGDGLVFNPGFERVEGYTNFLWVLLLAGFAALGLVPEVAAHVLSLAGTVALWGLVVWFTYRSPPAGGRRWLLVVAPLCLALTRSVAVWSTSGLETRLFEVLVVAGAFRLIVEVEARLTGRALKPLSSLLFGLATLTRPDGLLISLVALAVAGAQLAIRRRFDVRAFAVQVGAYGLLVGAHFVFRLVYYGQWLPNTYYAKVDGRTWWEMGWAYLGVFALEYGVYLWLPLIMVAVYEHWRRRTLFTPMLLIAVVVSHAVYVAAVGGDHFEYRPLDLYFPLMFVLLYDGVRRTARGTIGLIGTVGYLGVVLVGLTALPYQSHRQFPHTYRPAFPGEHSTDFMRPERDPIHRLPGLRQVAGEHLRLLRATTDRFVGLRQEEHRLFLDSVLSEGSRLKRLVETGRLPADTYIAIHAVGAIPYYSELRTLDRLGLTDAHVAHSEFRDGPRSMAHDKQATLDYGRRAGVDFWAFDGVHCLMHVTDPAWPRYIVSVAQREQAVFVADVGDGYYLIGFLPQGIGQARIRFPKLRFQPLLEPEVSQTIIRRAIEAHRQELRDNPDDDDIRMALANTLFFVGDAPAALELYEAIVPARPEDTRLWYRLSETYRNVGDLNRAIAATEHALELARNQSDERMMRALRKQLTVLRSRSDE